MSAVYCSNTLGQRAILLGICLVASCYFQLWQKELYIHQNHHLMKQAHKKNPNYIGHKFRLAISYIRGTIFMLKLVASAYLVGGTSNLGLVSGQGAHPDVSLEK